MRLSGLSVDLQLSAKLVKAHCKSDMEKSHAKLIPETHNKHNKTTTCMQTHKLCRCSYPNSWKTHKHQDSPSGRGYSRRRMFPGRPDVPPPRTLQQHRKGPPTAPRLLLLPPPQRAPPECKPGNGPGLEGLGRRMNEGGLCRRCPLPDRCPTHWLPGDPGACEGDGGGWR